MIEHTLSLNIYNASSKIISKCDNDGSETTKTGAGQDILSLANHNNDQLLDRSLTVNSIDINKVEIIQSNDRQTLNKDFGVPKFLVNKWLNVKNSKSKFLEKNCQVDNPADISVYSESSISSSYHNEINFLNPTKTSRFSLKKSKGMNSSVLEKPARTYSEDLIDSDIQISSDRSFNCDNKDRASCISIKEDNGQDIKEEGQIKCLDEVRRTSTTELKKKEMNSESIDLMHQTSSHSPSKRLQMLNNTLVIREAAENEEKECSIRSPDASFDLSIHPKIYKNRIFVKPSLNRRGERLVKKLKEASNFIERSLFSSKIVEKENKNKDSPDKLNRNTYESRNTNLRNYGTINESIFDTQKRIDKSMRKNFSFSKNQQIDTQIFKNRRVLSLSPVKKSKKKMIIPTMISLQDVADSKGLTFAKFNLRFKPPKDLINLKGKFEIKNNSTIKEVEHIINNACLKFKNIKLKSNKDTILPNLNANVKPIIMDSHIPSTNFNNPSLRDKKKYFIPQIKNSPISPYQIKQNYSRRMSKRWLPVAVTTANGDFSY